jgi:hypothetical protein
MENEITRLLVHEMSDDDFCDFLKFISELAANDVVIDNLCVIREDLCSCSNPKRVKSWFRKMKKDNWYPVLDNCLILLKQYIQIHMMPNGLTPPY